MMIVVRLGILNIVVYLFYPRSAVSQYVNHLWFMYCCQEREEKLENFSSFSIQMLVIEVFLLSTRLSSAYGNWLNLLLLLLLDVFCRRIFIDVWLPLLFQSFIWVSTTVEIPPSSSSSSFIAVSCIRAVLLHCWELPLSMIGKRFVSPFALLNRKENACRQQLSADFIVNSSVKIVVFI